MTNSQTLFPLSAFLLTLLGTILVIAVVALALGTVAVAAAVVFGGEIIGLR